MLNGYYINKLLKEKLLFEFNDKFYTFFINGLHSENYKELQLSNVKEIKRKLKLPKSRVNVYYESR